MSSSRQSTIDDDDEDDDSVAVVQEDDDEEDDGEPSDSNENLQLSHTFEVRFVARPIECQQW